MAQGHELESKEKRNIASRARTHVRPIIVDNVGHQAKLTEQKNRCWGIPSGWGVHQRALPTQLWDDSIAPYACISMQVDVMTPFF